MCFTVYGNQEFRTSGPELAPRPRRQKTISIHSTARLPRCDQEVTRKNERHQRAFVAAHRGTFARRQALRCSECDQDLGWRQDEGGRDHEGGASRQPQSRVRRPGGQHAVARRGGRGWRREEGYAFESQLHPGRGCRGGGGEAERGRGEDREGGDGCEERAGCRPRRARESQRGKGCVQACRHSVSFGR